MRAERLERYTVLYRKQVARGSLQGAPQESKDSVEVFSFFFL